MGRAMYAGSVLLLAGSCLMAQSAHQKMPLGAGWEFHQKADASSEFTAWRSAEVPGVVQTDLMKHKLIPDPFYRDNESKVQWIGNAAWEYRRKLDATPEILKRQHVELVFAGLDTLADVYLNDQRILEANNKFRLWRVDVKSKLKPGENTLRVEFRPVFPEFKKAAAADPYNAITEVAGKNYIRKAGYDYGWDWGPNLVPYGIWQPVWLDLWDDARISDFAIRQKDIAKEAANIMAEVEIASSVAAPVTVKVSYAASGKPVDVSREVRLHPGTNLVEIPISIVKPELWYPNGYGAQALYTFKAEATVNKRKVDEASARTGLRSMVLRRERDQWGRSFEFVVNGIPIFAKGADMIPFDNFPSRVTKEQYRRILACARDAHMNMVRQWGGGDYESDMFYDLCDEMGLMIWQDFKFANEAYPLAIRENIEAEAEYQVRRLRNHPSIALWCGNNETEWTWTGFGTYSPFTKLKPEGRDRIWQEYMDIFHGILPRIIERLTPETPYNPSSPSSDFEYRANEVEAGDAHNWEVWHGVATDLPEGIQPGQSLVGGPPSNYEKFIPRFMSEFGFQAFPDMRTIESFTQPEDRRYNSPVMDVHQKNNLGNGNEKIAQYIRTWYKAPRDFESFVYLSQLMQAEAVKIGAEHLRRNRPRTMGSTFWQLNDCWPVVSWASVDYYGRWKALQYYAKRFYDEVLVSPHQEGGNVAVYVISDRLEPLKAEVKVRVMNQDGTVLGTKQQTVEVPALSSKVYFSWPAAEIAALKGYDAKTSFVVAEVVSGGRTVSRNELYFSLPKDMQLLPAKIATELTGQGGTYKLRLSSNVLARNAFLSAGNLDIVYSDNFFDVLPGQPVEIELKTAVPVEQVKSALKVLTLTDTFAN